MRNKPKKHVLVVEDAPDWQKLISKLIQGAAGASDYAVEVVTAANFEEASSELATISYDCIIVNSKLSAGLMVEQLLAHIAGLGRKIPIIIIGESLNPGEVGDFFNRDGIEDVFWRGDFKPEKFRESLVRLLIHVPDFILSFFRRAGFKVKTISAQAGSLGFLCTSDQPLWIDVAPIYVRQVLERPLDMEEFLALCTAAEAAYGGDLRGHTAIVVIDRQPREGDLYQIFALRAQRGLTVVPLPRSLMLQAQTDRREMEALREQMELYTGRTDLYDARTAVTDVLSFFGRNALQADLERRLTTGRPVVVFGVRKMGKSSLLGRLREECAWPVALLDLQWYVGGLGYVYGAALHGWRVALQAAFPDLPLPVWTEGFSAPDPAAQAQAFRQAVVDLLGLLADRPGRPGLLLFLDEIEYLFRRPEYLEFAAILRSVAEDPRCRGRFALLMTGLEPALNRVDRMDGGRNPFYAFFGEIPLGTLKPEDTRTMVISIGSQMGIGYEEESLDLLVEAGGGHPFVMRQLCSQAIRDLERPGVVDAARASQAMEAYLRQTENYFADSLWGIDSGGPPPAEAALLQSLAAAQPQPDEHLIPPDLPPKEQRPCQRALNHLRDQSLIRRVEGGWELTVPLYRRWIRRYILNLPDEAAMVVAGDAATPAVLRQCLASYDLPRVPVKGDATMPAVLRQRLQRLDAVELESLCLDHFSVVYDKFTPGLQRGEKHNLLLDYCRRNPAAAERLDEILTVPAREEKQDLPSLPPAEPTINSGGGPVIMGDVHIKDGDFVGRDKHTQIPRKPCSLSVKGS